MEIKPIKKIKSVGQERISPDNYLKRIPFNTPLTSSNRQTVAFVNHRLYFEGKEMGEAINACMQNTPHHLSQMAAELEAFKEACLKKRKNKKNKRGLLGILSTNPEGYDEDELAVIFALSDAYIKKISDLIKKRYDETKDGINLVFDENAQLIINSMNIHAFVDQCRASPNPKSLLFLKGVRSRLAHVLENKVSSRNYERIRDVILELFKEIDEILGKGG
ncbi:MAG: hypothetical protein HQM16_03320 [Deltaproteobacteria bacterium]|nr:hypothetical protein [Deltaproteobacteria bacterium]